MPLVVVIALTLTAWLPATAEAASPQIAATWATDVTATSAVLHAEVDPEGLPTTARFEYLTEAAYQENLGARQGTLRRRRQGPAQR